MGVSRAAPASRIPGSLEDKASYFIQLSASEHVPPAPHQANTHVPSALHRENTHVLSSPALGGAKRGPGSSPLRSS